MPVRLNSLWMWLKRELFVDVVGSNNVRAINYFLHGLLCKHNCQLLTQLDYRDLAELWVNGRIMYVRITDTISQQEW